MLEEATSSLDTESERLIQQSINQIAQNTTIVVIAHRLSTVVSADCIYVLQQGRVVEEGTYNELNGRSGILQRMVALQELRSGT